MEMTPTSDRQTAHAELLRHVQDGTPAPRTCRRCSRAFTVQPGECAFLLAQFGVDAVLPRECGPCRRFRREARLE